MTTGQIIATHTNMGTKIMIAKDIGPYPGCKPEHNVRKLDEIRTLDITVGDDAYRNAIAGKDGYGTGWGDTGKLFPVSQDDIDLMVVAHNRRNEDKKAREKKEMAAIIADNNRRANHPGWCDKCHSYCYGDCEAD